MVTASTSRAAFDDLVGSGQLVGKQKHLLKILMLTGPATSGEIIDQIGRVKNVNAWRGRFTELQARGLIRQVGERPCKISGRLCIVWAATGRDTALDEGRKHVATSRAAEWQESAQQWRGMADLLATALEQYAPDSSNGCRTALESYRKLAKQERTRERRRGRS